MTSELTAMKVIQFVKISVALIHAWPPSSKATKFRILLFKVSWCACFLSSILLLLPLLNSIYEHRNDTVILGKAVCLCSAVIQTMVKTTVCRFQYSRFQMAYDEVETFCKQANDKTNVTLQYYVDKYKHSYGIYTLWCYLTAIGVICGPIYLPQQLPAPAEYPFPMQHYAVKSIIYIHQALVGFQAASAMCIDCSTAILLIYSVARLDLLASKMRNITNESELDACIKLHDEILRYTAELINIIKPLVFTTVTTTAVAVIFGGLNIVTEQPLMVKIQYSIVIFTASIELLMCALPADSLMHMSNNICFASYESRWFQGNVSMQKKIIRVICRSQTPEVIRINGFLPTLSLRYYGVFLYTVCSYFTALRIIVNKNVLD